MRWYERGAWQISTSTSSSSKAVGISPGRVRPSCDSTDSVHNPGHIWEMGRLLFSCLRIIVAAYVGF